MASKSKAETEQEPAEDEKSPAVLMAKMQGIVDLSDAETRSLTDEEVETYEGLEQQLKAVNRTGEIAKRQEAYKAPRVDGFPATIKASPKGDKALEFAFASYLRTGVANSDLTQSFAQTEGTTTAGGFSVPSESLGRLVEAQTAFGGFGPLAENITTADGRPLAWPSTTAVTSSQADIAAEGAISAVGADLTFGEVTLGAFKYSAEGTGNVPLKVSFELAQDSSVDIASLVMRKLGERIARKQAYDLIRGSGSGEPLGIMAGTAGDVATASGSVPTYAKFLALLHALDPYYRQNASWIMNDATLAVVEGLLDTNARPLFMPGQQAIADGPYGAQAGTLLGKPLIIDQGIANLSNNVQGVGFGDWKEAYIVRHVKDVQVLANPYSQSGYIVYDAWARMDGTVKNFGAYVTMEGLT